MNKQSGQAPNLIEKILFGDRRWGYLRRYFVLTGFLVIGAMVFVNNSQVFSIQPALSLAEMIWYLKNEFLRYLIVPVAVMINLVLLGGLYVQDIYELENYNDALRFLITALFSILLPDSLRSALRFLIAVPFFTSFPEITIQDGQAILADEQINLLDVIGGPGWVVVTPGNAVLLESLKSPTRVLGCGRHFIPRFEKIKTIVDLKDQESILTKPVSATTQDGIMINASDICFRYRIASDSQGRHLRRSIKNPYPFSEDAVVKYTYRRTVGKKGLTEWHDAVGLAVDSVISDYINQNSVDQITAPDSLREDPRDKIKQQMEALPTHNRLNDIGSELLWVDIGHFEIGMIDINRKHIEAWETKWSGKISLIRAQGEAEKIALQEQGRAEGQAAILTSIVNSLQEAGFAETDENLWNIVLARTAQILEATTSIYQLDDYKRELNDER